jgi:hypothetical protein
MTQVVVEDVKKLIMKQKILITFGVILVIIAAAIGIYVLLFSQNSGGGVFSSFNQSGGEPVFPNSSGQSSSQNTTPSTLQNNAAALRKLTDKRVAAAVFVGDTVRYVERGTGYIYDVSLGSDDETKISNTTVPRVVEAVFSNDGARVAMAAEDGGVRKAAVGTITKNDSGEGVVTGVALPNDARGLQFSPSGDELYYMVRGASGAAGYSYNIPNQTQTRLFYIPLSDITVLWGSDASDMYVYTTPSAEAEGHIYKMDGNTLSYVMPGAPGLIAGRIGATFLVSETDPSNRAIDTFVLGKNSVSEAPLRVFPEKCTNAALATSTIYCATPETIPYGTYPDDWYKGLISLPDSLWSLSLSASSSKLTKLADLSNLSGENIDVSSIYHSSDGHYLAFINKNDDSLWLYDLTMSSAAN